MSKKQPSGNVTAGAIMQPTYFPWLGLFDLIDRSDVFVFLDDVQIIKRSWDARNRIKSANGELYLTVPVKKKHRDEMCFNNTEINYEEKWVKKHLKSLELSYRKAPYFQEVYEFVQNILLRQYASLAELNIATIRSIAEKWEVNVDFRKSSDLNVKGKRDQLLVEICETLGIHYYISPQGSAEYIEKDRPAGHFSESSVKLVYQNFKHPFYSQLWGEFTSHLSIIDALMNCGFQGTLEIIRQGRQPNYDVNTFRKLMKQNN